MSSRKGRAGHPYGTVSPDQGFRPLLDSRLSTADIPALLARHNGSSISPMKTRAIRLLGWMLGVGIIFWFANSMLRSEKPPSAVNYLSSDGKAYEIVGDDQLPDEATPIVVTDKRGRSKWTVSIPPSLDFPLRPVDYANLCAQSGEIAQQVEELKHPSHHHMGHFDYYHVDPNFMDVGDAEEHGMLPGVSAAPKKHIWGKVMGDNYGDNMGEDVVTMQGDGNGKFCEKSLTYVMETGDAGMGSTLMALWMSYGLAQRENRAFFIDDTHWAYGNYTTFFKPPPKPTCLLPPRTQILPCPHHARHLLVSSGTIRNTFGHKFHDYFEDARKMEVYRLKNFFQFMRTGYEALFELNGPDAAFLARHLDSLNSTIRGKGGLEIGVHVRHGDRHPLDFQYQKSYLPLDHYANAAKDALAETFTTGTPGAEKEDFSSEVASKLLLASDDPDVYTAPEFSHALKAQSHINLASKSALPDSSLGFEGGFFKDVFWSLGQSSPSAPEGSPAPTRRQLPSHPPTVSRSTDTDHRNPSADALNVRELLGRAYLLDLAVLGQTDRVICGVSSNTCRILAVMMGWERAIEQKGWRNIDGSWDWGDIVW